jgi:asparagine synthetase B (glutamine-hydrolysing)
MMALGPARYQSQAREWRKPIEETFVHWFGWSQRELEALTGRPTDFSETFMWQQARELMSESWQTVETELYGGIWEPHADYRNTHTLGRALGKAVRFPFVDQRLIRFVNQLPEELKFQGGLNKIILRAFMQKHLPADILAKPKGAFIFDLKPILLRQDESLAGMLLKEGQMQILPEWSLAVIERVAEAFEEGDDSLVDRVYAVCLLALWNEMRLEGLRHSSERQ